MQEAATQHARMSEDEAQDLSFVLGASRHAASLVGDCYCFFAGPGDTRRIPIARISQYQRFGWITLSPGLQATVAITTQGLAALANHFRNGEDDAPSSANDAMLEAPAVVSA